VPRRQVSGSHAGRGIRDLKGERATSFTENNGSNRDHEIKSNPFNKDLTQEDYTEQSEEVGPSRL
jgi:hypothetical protein